MIKKIIAIILIIMGMICIGSTVVEFFIAGGKMNVWSIDVMGAAAFHGICMITAAFLLSGKSDVKKAVKN